MKINELGLQDAIAVRSKEDDIKLRNHLHSLGKTFASGESYLEKTYYDERSRNEVIFYVPDQGTIHWFTFGFIIHEMSDISFNIYKENLKELGI